MNWTCFAASGPGQLAVIAVVQDNVRTSAETLNCRSRVMQQDNEWLQEDQVRAQMSTQDRC